MPTPRKTASVPRKKSAAPRVRRATGRVTLEDVARVAQVSAQTVSRVFNQPETVAPDTVARVVAAVSKTGYGPAHQTSGPPARSRLVAMLVPAINGTVFAETIEALSKALASNGYQMMLGESGYQDEDEETLLDNILRRQPDGIVFTRVVRSERARERLRRSGVAVVESWDQTDAPIDMLIGFSHAEVGRTVARLFADTGRKCPGLLIGDDPRATRRGDAYVAEVAARGLLRKGFAQVPMVRLPAPATLGAGRTGLGALLERCPDLDAVFCSTDMAALGVLTEARMRGLRVPQDLAVVGFADLAFAHQTDPALTTVRIDGTAIGRMAARYVMNRAEGWGVDEPVVDVGFQLVRRGSA